jgi:hypothetical protein
MNLATRSHWYMLIAFIVAALLLVMGLGLASAQGAPRLEITAVDATQFPDMHVTVMATDGPTSAVCFWARMARPSTIMRWRKRPLAST